ncbi:hypothetical protein B0H13DRAFT_2554542 [Mycena leptocephala]|nr:hypothetical protein B0H13DRAFT_2554542 [Mycena leptocephala]
MQVDFKDGGRGETYGTRGGARAAHCLCPLARPRPAVQATTTLQTTRRTTPYTDADGNDVDATPTRPRNASAADAHKSLAKVKTCRASIGHKARLPRPKSYATSDIEKLQEDARTHEVLPTWGSSRVRRLPQGRASPQQNQRPKDAHVYDKKHDSKPEVVRKERRAAGERARGRRLPRTRITRTSPHCSTASTRRETMSAAHASSGRLHLLHTIVRRNADEIVSTSHPHSVYTRRTQRKKEERQRTRQTHETTARFHRCVSVWCWLAAAWLPRKDCWRYVSRAWSKPPVVEVKREVEEFELKERRQRLVVIRMRERGRMKRGWDEWREDGAERDDVEEWHRPRRVSPAYDGRRGLSARRRASICEAGRTGGASCVRHRSRRDREGARCTCMASRSRDRRRRRRKRNQGRGTWRD